MIRVFLIEPLTVFREALSRVLEGQPDMQIIGEAGSAADALPAIRLSGTAEVLVVVGLEADGPGEELQSLRRIKQEFPTIFVLATAPSADNVTISHALFSGADSFLPQDREISELIDSIRRTADGEAVIVTSRRRTSHPSRPGSTGERGAQLTERELQVLRLAGAGLTARQIARELRVQERTVTTHLQHIYRKLRVSNRVAALRAASRAGILDPSSVGDDVHGRSSPNT
jgi:two-component system response regulator DevR